MNWFYENDEYNPPIPNPYEGFVYLIENTVNNKMYVGKKHFWTRQKNKKTGRREKKESDWRNYYGSSDELNSDIAVYGKENFKRTILYLCIYKKQMTYMEQKEQWDRNVLFNDLYYNTNIAGKFFIRERRIYSARIEDI